MSRDPRERRPRGRREKRADRRDDPSQGGARDERSKGGGDERSRADRRDERSRADRRDERPRGRRRDDDFALLWARPEPGERRPAHTREAIATAALHIADTEGFEAVTMRRVATELGAGTMTLYHYVRNKDELTALMSEAIMGELVIPDDELPEGWREGFAAIARRTRDLFARHPWIVEHMDDDEQAPWGPNALRHVEQSIAIASQTGLAIDEQFELTALIDDYVFGYAMRAQENIQDQLGSERRLEAMISYLETQLQTGNFPHLEQLGDDPREGIERIARVAADTERFERGLQRLLDGIALDLERRAG